jgi:hypothetical protein
LLQAIKAQDRVGWLTFFEGCMTLEWSGLQEAHFLWLGPCNTGKRWATSLVVKLWEVAWDLCGHRNEIKINTETAQDCECCAHILLAVCSEYTFFVILASCDVTGDCLFKHPLLSLSSQAQFTT